MINFSEYQRANPHVPFDVILTVHDSIMAEVGMDHVEYVANEVFPLCMTTQAICPARPFEIAIDIDVSDRWDESLNHSAFIDRGFSEDFALEYCKKDDDGKIIVPAN